jgi:CO/xanthine dehydrogenase FAD-binding subunit
MRAFEVFTAKDAQHAVSLLAEHAARAKVKVLAGGTDLLADLKFASASHAPAVVVDISRAAELRRIAVTDRGLSIGALVTHTEIMRSPVIRETFPALGSVSGGNSRARRASTWRGSSRSTRISTPRSTSTASTRRARFSRSSGSGASTRTAACCTG